MAQAIQRRILFVEDDPALQRIMLKWLSGYTVESHDNGDNAYESALSFADQGTPVDLFLLDITLRQCGVVHRREIDWIYHEEPIDNGIKLAKLLRRQDAYKETPIIFLSGRLKKAEDRQSLSDRVQAICYQKPIPYKELQDRIRDILGHPEKTYWQRFAEMIAG